MGVTKAMVPPAPTSDSHVGDARGKISHTGDHLTRTTWCLLGFGVLLLLIAWSFRDYATLWRGRWRPLPLQPSLSSEGHDGQWTMWRGNAQRTGVQAQPLSVPRGQVQWQFINGAGFISSPIAAGDSLFVGDTKGRLSRLRRSDGRVIWQLKNWGRLTRHLPWRENCSI